MPSFLENNNRWKKSLKIAVIVAAISYVAIFTIPFYQGKIVEPDTLCSNLHSSINKRLRLHVREGDQYELRISSSHSGSINSDLQLYSHSLKLVRMSISSPEYYMNTVHTVIFTSDHGMYYYLTLDFEKEDTFVVIMEEVNNAVDSETVVHLNVTKLLILLSPLFILLLLSLFAFLNYYRNKVVQKIYQNLKKKRISDNTFSCPSCGVFLNKNAEYCKTCGRTFKIPDPQLI